MTEDRGITNDTVGGGQIGACFYRYVPSKSRRRLPLAETTGPLQALRLKDELNANMNTGRAVGSSFPVAWETIDEPDHEDDTDNRLDRVAGFTPNRV
jgi:hypothetical protein